jgi:hypothetical protein
MEIADTSGLLEITMNPGSIRGEFPANMELVDAAEHSVSSKSTFIID